jgi:UDP-N-acetylmuramoyl-tripeptide--D-alanyl-D-alanine ligase
MINNLIFYISIMVWMLYAGNRIRKSVHMLQLNSYYNDRFNKWNIQNLRKTLSLKEWIPLLFVIPLVFDNTTVALIIWIFAFLLLWLIRSKEKEKKKLVYTSRVKRLITTIFLILLIITLAMTQLVNNYKLMVWSFLFLIDIMPFLIVVAANTINGPMERQINKSYLNDARKMILSMRDLLVIGITGSYGKTSVKHFLNTVLNQQNNVLITPESYNTPMGITKTIRNMLRPTHDIFISEMGAKQRGDIKELCDLVNPRIGILTSIGNQHLESFKTLKNIQDTKFELIEALPQDGIGFLNFDDANISSRKLNFRCKIITFGIRSTNLDYQAHDIKYSSTGTQFQVSKKDGTTAIFESILLGEHNVNNILACIAVGSELGIPLDKLVLYVRKIKAVQHRLEILHRANQITIIDDSYNSNPVGSKAALDVLKQLNGRRILITPGMVELGDKEYELNKSFGVYAAEVCDYIILVGKNQTKHIQDGLTEAGYPESKLYIAKNLNDALQHLDKVADSGSFVLLENDLPDNYIE